MRASFAQQARYYLFEQCTITRLIHSNRPRRNIVFRTMKKTALLLLLSLGLSPVLFSSCSSLGSTAGNGTGSYAKATAGSNGVQWNGGNDVSSETSVN
jgi:hypothetical protein